MGEDVRVEAGDTLNIRATATLNPDLGQLESFELIQQGDVIVERSVGDNSQKMHLQHTLKMERGSWFVIKAQGQRLGQPLVAISAPIYVYANGLGFCKPSSIPSLVDKYQQQLQDILVQSIDVHAEPWSVQDHKKIVWPKNKIILQDRIDQTNGKYNAILTLAKKGRCISGSL
jgi:hypothetical protein